MSAEGNLSATGIERCGEAHAEVSRGHSRCHHEPKGRTWNTASRRREHTDSAMKAEETRQVTTLTEESARNADGAVAGAEAALTDLRGRPFDRLRTGFSESSYGFRPGRNAHQAVKAAKQYVAEGRRVVVDMDLEKT